ncbi:outer membrane protein assembly factor BamB [Natronospira proteinivora]|uniref:Outer membrane protein assembly factor BamB n=1 Tax=Natronospira proteinivora TaxID=1807133 RepID=A0ABT1G512_9GAMM|nr:PQQ-binding-like beta-propeller repeat protein [Natronospira proteinivora]MCP1726386.1 outer membrane protein assembly factor BamB [Natronospira proteinivora]
MNTSLSGILVSSAAVTVLALQGCASLESEVDPDWESEAWAGAETAATADGSRLVLAGSRHVFLLDGSDGELIGGIGELEESFSDQMRRAFNPVAGNPDYPLEARNSNVVLLPEAGKLLIFNYQHHSEKVTAVDIDSGDTQWHTDQFNYSVQQYEQHIRRATEAAGQALSTVLGGEGSGESAENRRARQYLFAQSLVESVDDGDAIIFKTFQGLVKLDAETGNQHWQVREFGGPGILDVATLDNGDYLVASTGQDLSRLQVADAYHLARISPEGELRWLNEHSGDNTQGLHLASNHVVVDGETIEVFDLDQGENLWQGPERWRMDDHTDPRALPQPAPLLSDNALYQAASAHGEDGGFVSTGFPHRIRSYDMDTGETRWETPEVDTFFGELQKIDDQLIVWGAGEFFGDHDGGGIAALNPETGEVLWNSPEMETPGLVSQSKWVVEPVYDANKEHVFIAGPEELYGFRIRDGEQILERNLADTGLGDTVGLTEHNGALIVIGQDGVTAYDMNNGEQHFQVETENITDYFHRDDRLVLKVSAGGIMAMAEPANGDDGPSAMDPRTGDNIRTSSTSSVPSGVVALDLPSGNLGQLAAWDLPERLRFGPLSDVFVTDDGQYAYIVGDRARLFRYTL